MSKGHIKKKKLLPVQLAQERSESQSLNSWVVADLAGSSKRKVILCWNLTANCIIIVLVVIVERVIILPLKFCSWMKQGTQNARVTVWMIYAYTFTNISTSSFANMEQCVRRGLWAVVTFIQRCLNYADTSWIEIVFVCDRAIDANHVCTIQVCQQKLYTHWIKTGSILVQYAPFTVDLRNF